MSRGQSLRRAGHEAAPTMGLMVALFFLAAPIEGFLSPSPLPYSIKAAVAIVSAVLLLFYVVVLGSRPIPETESLSENSLQRGEQSPFAPKTPQKGTVPGSFQTGSEREAAHAV